MSSLTPGLNSLRFGSALLFLALLLAFGVGASEAQTVSFSNDGVSDTFGCSETITVSVDVSGFTDLRGFSWILTYDAGVMTPLSVTPGSAWGGCSNADFWVNEDTANGTVEADVVGLGCSVPGPGSVLEVVFEAASPGTGVSAGTSALSLSGRARDSNNVSISYSVTDGSVTYDCNVAPVAVDDTATTDEDVAVLIDVTANDTDVDGSVDPTTVAITTPAANGSLGVDPITGDITYTPAADFFGADSFQYAVDDDDGATSSAATVDVTVDPVNDSPTLTNPGDQTNVEGDNLNLALTSTDPDGPGESWSASGLPGGLSIDPSTGEISGTVICSASDSSPYATVITIEDNGSPVESDTVSFTWTVDPVAAPAAITDLAASQVKTGNDTDGTTRITLTWSGVGGGNGIRVFRRGFGGYPEYTGSVPTAPATLAGAESDADWVETAVTSSGEDDEVAQRDFWYYVAFVQNPCGNQASGPSNLTGGTLNYHLGDVTDGVTVGQGDNAVFTGDVAAIGVRYGITPTAGNWVSFLDFGPTIDFSVDARPNPDDLIDFEDLILLAINYDAVGKAGSAPDPSDRNRITLQVPASVENETFEVHLHMQADGRVQGMSLPLTWDATVVEPTGAFGGELLTAQGRLTRVLTPRQGVVDVTLFGVGERALSGDGRLATVTFRVIGEGDPAIDLGPPIARDADNASLTLETDREIATGTPSDIPRVSYLEQNYPNPFNPSTNIRFGLAKASRVEIRVYSLSGRMIRSLVSEQMSAGTHTVTWNGRDDTGTSVASGTYLVRLSTADGERTRRMALIK